MAEVFFFLAAIGALAGAIGTVTLRNPFYSVLAQAERQGLIRESTAAQSTRRRVYALAPLGKRVLAAEAERLAAQLKATRAALVAEKKRA